MKSATGLKLLLALGVLGLQAGAVAAEATPAAPPASGGAAPEVRPIKPHAVKWDRLVPAPAERQRATALTS